MAADVFVSYKRDDAERAKLVVDTLAKGGISAWWDWMIPPGANWDKSIETAISHAQCVIVLWSKGAVTSDNVRCEADFARDAGVLVPAKIEDCELPLFHRMTQYVDIKTWNGDTNDSAWKALIDRVRAKLTKDPRAKLGSWGFGIAPPRPHIWQRYNSAARVVVSILRGEPINHREIALSSISEVKGLFNRVRRKDQWDWFIVWQRFGFPPIAQLWPLVEELENVRNRLKDSNLSRLAVDQCGLMTSRVLTLLLRFLGEEPIVRPECGGIIFILSAKHNPDAILVGATKDDVITIADDLTKRLGAKTPFGIVHAWPVKDVASAKGTVFDELSRQGFSSPLDRVLADTRILCCNYKNVVPIVGDALQATGVLGYDQQLPQTTCSSFHSP